ncbi:hypothetical protein [Streptomyces sp. NPDC047079]|uniref:hypothetical protein n=1 Tax=Streptomyces sp. NPDC047079 TaxID=3154607 RepID=UPI0033DB9103
MEGWPAKDPATRARRLRIARVAAAVVVCAGFAIGVWALVGGDGQPSRGERAKASSSSESRTVGSTAEPTAEDSAALTGSPPAVPGFRQAAEDGFSLAVPEGWERSVKKDQIFYTAPDKRSLIQIGVTDNPTKSPYEALSDVEKDVSTRQDYVNLGLKETPTAQGAAAELHYSYTNADSGPRLVLDRAFDSGSRQYAVLVAVPADEAAWGDKLQRSVLAYFCTESFNCPTPPA